MRTLSKILFLALSILLFSCEDILEEDITDKTATIITPQEGDVIESNVVNFQWNTITGADKYRVQVYSATHVIVVDSLVENSSVTLPLNEGNYQWRVRGENFAYQSSYSFPVNFELEEPLDLSNQQVLLENPSNNAYTNNQNLILSWSPLNAADSYELIVVNVTNGNLIRLQQSGITATTYTLNSSILNQDAKYEWKVKAVNSFSNTDYFFKTFYLDTVLPNQSQNTSPANNAEQTLNPNQDVSFTWTTPTDSGTIQSAVSYIIQIASDAAFTSNVQTFSTAASGFSHRFDATGEYYWHVKAVDAAGNIGNYNSTFKLTLN
jgi:hypothetical protein